MKLKDFLEKQLASGKLTWNSKSELIRASGNNINGYNNKILEEYKSKFKFGSSLEIKNNEIITKILGIMYFCESLAIQAPKNKLIAKK